MCNTTTIAHRARLTTSEPTKGIILSLHISLSENHFSFFCTFLCISESVSPPLIRCRRIFPGEQNSEYFNLTTLYRKNWRLFCIRIIIIIIHRGGNCDRRRLTEWANRIGGAAGTRLFLCCVEHPECEMCMRGSNSQLTSFPFVFYGYHRRLLWWKEGQRWWWWQPEDRSTPTDLNQYSLPLFFCEAIGIQLTVNIRKKRWKWHTFDVEIPFYRQKRLSPPSGNRIFVDCLTRINPALLIGQWAQLHRTAFHFHVFAHFCRRRICWQLPSKRIHPLTERFSVFRPFESRTRMSDYGTSQFHFAAFRSCGCWSCQEESVWLFVREMLICHDNRTHWNSFSYL